VLGHTCLGLVPELEDGTEVFVTIQFFVFDSFYPWEVRDVNDLCCYRGS